MNEPDFDEMTAEELESWADLQAQIAEDRYRDEN